MPGDPKEFILWAQAHGATRVRIDGIEVEFGKPARPAITMPVQEAPKPLQVKDIDGKAVEGVPDYIHAVGCPCEQCKYTFMASG